MPFDICTIFTSSLCHSSIRLVPLIVPLCKIPFSLSACAYTNIDSIFASFIIFFISEILLLETGVSFACKFVPVLKHFFTISNMTCRSVFSGNITNICMPLPSFAVISNPGNTTIPLCLASV